VDGLRQAASFEGLIVLAVIYFVLTLLQKAGKKAEQGRRRAPPPLPEPEASTPTQQESLSLESILREIERVKQQGQTPARPEPLPRPAPPLPRPAPPPRQAPQPRVAKPLPSRRPPPPRRKEVVQDDRGPLGRRGRARLPGAEEVEDQTSLEGGSLEVPESLENFDEVHRRRPVVDHDAEAESIVQRRIEAAQARDREHREVDHQSFHARIRGDQPKPGTDRRHNIGRLREAVVWREILGPPKGLE
jgi:hypothetical protein